LDILQLRVLNRSGQHLPFNSFSNLESMGPETLIEYRDHHLEVSCVRH
jgi:hypothetical protein